MCRNRAVYAGLTALALAAPARAQIDSDAAVDCDSCAAWNAPLAPFQIYGNTYYVGTTELAAILIATEAGLMLLDGALPQSAPLIDASIRALGFDTADVTLMVNSHTHFDHAGGLAALQRASGAEVAASAPAAAALRRGGPTPDDPQFDTADNGFPPVRAVRVVADGETLAIGNVRLTAHLTPGHTPGGTTWTWQACEAERCLDVVYADSLTAVSADSFKFTDARRRGALVQTFEDSIRRVASLPCDILLAPHPGFIGLQQKLERRRAGDANAFTDANACRDYASAAAERLRARIARENAAAP